MKIFSTHRKKLDARRRFGTRSFQDRIKIAANYKRVFSLNPNSAYISFFRKIGLASKFWRRLAILVIFVLAYFLIISSELVITQIVVSGNSQVSSQQIAGVIGQAGQSRLFLIKKNNYFLMTQGRINRMLTSVLPTIKEVTKVNRTWPDKISFEVRERTPGFVINSNGEFFLLDEEGLVVSQIEDPGQMLVAIDQITEDFARDEALPNQKLAPFILSMSKQWPDKMNVAIAAVKFPGKASSDVEFLTSAGWIVLFDVTRPVIKQLTDLVVILNKQIGSKDLLRLAYIDLRSDKWVYYCFKETPCQQQAQPSQAGAATEAQ